MSQGVAGGAPIVFVHGTRLTGAMWRSQIASLESMSVVAIDLPGHGHSDHGRNGSTDVAANAPDIADAITALAPDAKVVVGMSLGGISTLALAAYAPQLVRSAVLVDVTPGVNAQKSSAISNFINGPESFDDFDTLLARTIEHNPTRTVSSLRRGILHNALQRDDGSWVWRYARPRAAEGGRQPEFSFLWDVLSTMTIPLMLVRGMLPQSVVDDDDERELLRRAPHAQIVHVPNAGHSVQGDTPVELAEIIARFVDEQT